MCQQCNNVINFYSSYENVYLLSSISYVTGKSDIWLYKPCYWHGFLIFLQVCKREWTHQIWSYIFYICIVFCYSVQRKTWCSVVSASKISNGWWCCCISAVKIIKDNLLLKLPGHIVFNKSRILFRDYNKETLCLIINFIFILAKHPPLDRLPCFVKKNQHSGNEVLVLLCGHSKEYVEVM